MMDIWLPNYMGGGGECPTKTSDCQKKHCILSIVFSVLFSPLFHLCFWVESKPGLNVLISVSENIRYCLTPLTYTKGFVKFSLC